MTDVKALSADQLFHACDPRALAFGTTAELENFTGVLGQARAVEALEFGFGIQAKGYNIFAVGRDGLGKRSIVLQLLAARARAQAAPMDWCYVYDFDAPQKPRLMKLPRGIAVALKQDLEHAVEALRAILPAVFDGEDYQARRRTLEGEFKARREKGLEHVQDAAHQRSITLVRTPNGFIFAPVRGEEVVGPQEFERMEGQEREKIEKDIKFLQDLLQTEIRRLPQINREFGERIKQLNREVAQDAVAHLVGELRHRYKDLADVLGYLSAVEKDVVENFDEFIPKTDGENAPELTLLARSASAGLRRYQVNILVSRPDDGGAPVIYEDNPSYTNLLGRIEHVAQFGALTTDFTMIRSGALQRANGGYLVLDARKVIAQAFAWDGLKRALQAQEVRIEPLGQALSLISTVSLEPQAMPLNVKVVLLGDPELFYLLHELDPEFTDLFKVTADFSRDISRTPENDLLYARYIATAARRENLLPFDCGAVARVIEQGSRAMEDTQKIATSMRLITEILVESNYWALQSERAVVTREDVQRALDKRVYRMDRIRERLHEETLRKTIVIATDGQIVGQVNGLTVMELGEFAFGRPSRITARVWPGDGEVLDIEREVDLGGDIHSKGVLILQGFLAQRFATEHALSMAASIVFEQSYGEVDGDSASCAELFALISAIADAPINQHFAVTGAISQHGEVQAIGGVNEKIEGFFDLCVARGLTGQQGVLIPVANVEHLMLRAAVIEAVSAGKFHIYPIRHIDEGIAILTGLPTGELDENGVYPKGSINYKVAKRLQKFHAGSEGGEQKRKRTRKDLAAPPSPTAAT
ncbi:MAG: AAA family ATPase [Pseudomonadota bacterium]